MKLTPPMITAISIAALLCLVQIYVDVEWLGSSGELRRLKGVGESQAAQLSAMQGMVDSFRQSTKVYDAAIGSKGSIQLLASALQSGDFDLSVKTLRVVSNGKAVVSLGANPDAGGVIQVVSNDGTGTAEVSAAPGKGRVALKATTGADAAQVVHMAMLASDGIYLQKGATEDVAARTDGAGLQILDAGSNFFMSQRQGGNVSIDTSTADERAKLSVWSETSPKKIVILSAGAKDASPYVSASGAASGYMMMLVPDRLSLLNKDGNETMAAAGDASGGFVIANDQAGERRAIMASGNAGKGSIGVFGSDGRSNTFLPEFDIQKAGSTQK
jgi:hypothetical protein